MDITINEALAGKNILEAWIKVKEDKWNHDKLPLRVGRNLRKLTNELKEFEDRRVKVAREMARKDEDGNFIPATKTVKGEDGADTEEPIPNSLSFDDPAAVDARIAAMAEEVISVDIHPIPESWTKNDPAPSLLTFYADFLMQEEEDKK